jgi:hypothetical protein
MNLVQTEMGLQVRSNGLPSDRELHHVDGLELKVTSHPQGGWTIATHRPAGGPWIYHGAFATHDQAVRVACCWPRG